MSSVFNSSLEIRKFMRLRVYIIVLSIDNWARDSLATLTFIGHLENEFRMLRQYVVLLGHRIHFTLTEFTEIATNSGYHLANRHPETIDVDTVLCETARTENTNSLCASRNSCIFAYHISPLHKKNDTSQKYNSREWKLSMFCRVKNDNKTQIIKVQIIQEKL